MAPCVIRTHLCMGTLLAATTLCVASCEHQLANNHYAVSTLIVARHAQANYHKMRGEYAANLADLKDYVVPLPPLVAEQVKAYGEPRELIPDKTLLRGYAFSLRVADNAYAISAMPVADPDPANAVHYFVDESEVVRWRSGAPAGPTDSAVSTP